MILSNHSEIENCSTLQIPRRSSLKRGSISNKDEYFDRLPPINQKTIPLDCQSPRNSFSSSRRNSTYRRFSINQNPEQTFQHSVTFAYKTENDIMRDSIPLVSIPRFSCELSIEGRYAVFKGYEKILIQKLEKLNPEYVNLINKTSTTVANSINSVTLNKELIRLKTNLFDREWQSFSNPNEKKKKSHNKKNLYNEMGDLNSSSSEEYQIQNGAKLLMSRYLQFAHLILDNLKSSDVVKSSKYFGKIPQENFNLIKSWNWWNASWQENFIQKYEHSKISN